MITQPRQLPEAIRNKRNQEGVVAQPPGQRERERERDSEISLVRPNVPSQRRRNGIRGQEARSSTENRCLLRVGRGKAVKLFDYAGSQGAEL